MKLSTYQRAVTELMVAGAFWGLSFTCARWALEDFSASSLIFWRFLFALIIGGTSLVLFQKNKRYSLRNDLKLSFKFGCFLGLSIIFQTYGLKYTTAIKSSFITSLYVVLIPLIGGFIFRHQIKKQDIWLSLIAFAGMGLLLDIFKQSSFQFNQGDFLTLACAVSSSFHIIYVGIAARKVHSPFRLNILQTFWSLLLITPFLLYESITTHTPLWPETVHLKPLLSLLILSIFVSLLAFYLQIRAQRILSATTSSLLCLLEAPYALFFAITLLGESLNFIQGLGVFLILLSSVWSIYIDRPQDG